MAHSPHRDNPQHPASDTGNDDDSGFADNHPRRLADELPRHCTFRRAAARGSLERFRAGSSSTASGANDRGASAQRSEQMAQNSGTGAWNSRTTTRRPENRDTSATSFGAEKKWPRDGGTARARNRVRWRDPPLESIRLAQFAAGRWARARILRRARGPSSGANRDGRPSARASGSRGGYERLVAVDRTCSRMAA